MIPQDYPLAVEANPRPEDVQALRDGLRAHNVPFVKDTQSCELATFYRQPDGTIMGGIYGELDWNWLYVDLVWLHPALRGRGCGRQMMQAVEQAALARGVNRVYLATTSFQALPFYQRIGYTLFGQLEDRPPGYAYYYLKKENITRQRVASPFTAQEAPDADDVREVAHGLRQHTLEHKQSLVSRQLGIFIREADGTVSGGLFGRTYWGWLDLNFIWLHEKLRGQGWGARLLALAEQECITRGTPSIVADTTSFQALPFYLKHGFEVFGQLKDRPRGYTSYFIRKHLAR